MEDFHEGLSERAPILIKEADRIRTEGLAAAGNNSPLPPEAVIACAKKLAPAFSSVARCGYRPDYKPPSLLAVAALQTALSQFEQFPSLAEVPRPDPFDRSAYHLLQDWAIDVSKMPDFNTLGETQRKAVAASLQRVGAETLIAVERCGVDAVEGFDTYSGPPEDAGPTRIETCLAAISLACRVGPFSRATTISSAQWEFLGSQIVEAYETLIDKAEEVSDEREELIFGPPQKGKGQEIAKPGVTPAPIPAVTVR